MRSEKFLEKYLNAFSPVGEEHEGQKIWVDEVRPFADEIVSDAYGTAYALKRGTIKENPRKVVIEAHCDEIAWIVTQIEKEGFLRVKRHGGSDNMIASSKTVLIHTRSGETVPGVFGSPAVHVREKYTEMGPDQHELWIDLGFDSDESVKSCGVEVGNLVTFDDQFKKIGNYYVGRSLDNKIGGYIIAEALKLISQEGIQLPYDLYVVNSVQEEVGLYGAKMIAKRLQADIALVHDVCHNTSTPKMDKAKNGDIKGGSGPTLEFTAQNHRKIIAKVREVAEANSIDFQLQVGSYGNDTMAFFLENTPTAIVATPLKYMHTTVEMAHVDDVENCIVLFTEFLKSIDPDWIWHVKNPKI
jgi:putative aminopeptidase FrvX